MFGPFLMIRIDAVLRLVAAGLGVAVVPKLVVGPNAGLVGIRIEQPQLTRTIALAHRRDRYLSTAARTLRAMLLSQNEGRRINPEQDLAPL